MGAKNHNILSKLELEIVLVVAILNSKCKITWKCQ